MTGVALLLWVLVALAFLVVTHPGFPWTEEVKGASADDHWDLWKRNAIVTIEETRAGLAAPLDPKTFLSIHEWEREAALSGIIDRAILKVDVDSVVGTDPVDLKGILGTPGFIVHPNDGVGSHLPWPDPEGAKATWDALLGTEGP